MVDLGYSVYLWQGVGGDPVKEKGSITLVDLSAAFVAFFEPDNYEDHAAPVDYRLRGDVVGLNPEED